MTYFQQVHRYCTTTETKNVKNMCQDLPDNNLVQQYTPIPSNLAIFNDLDPPVSYYLNFYFLENLTLYYNINPDIYLEN